MVVANDITIRKVKCLHWEAWITIGNIVYTLPAWTESGAKRKAHEFVEAQS